MNGTRGQYIVLIIIAAVAALATPALGKSFPHHRQGLQLGFGLGGGGFQVVRQHAGTTTHSPTEQGGVVALRIGYAFDSRFVLGLESASLSRQYADGSVTISTFVLNLTWHPAGGGFFVRGGLGTGAAQLAASLGPIALSATDGGPAVALGLGYEWRLTRTFALGGAIDLRGLDLDDTAEPDWRLHNSSYTLQFNWYL